MSKSTLRAACLSLAACLIGVTGAKGATYTWDGGATSADTSWNNPLNWSGDVVPGAADTVAFTSAGLPASTVISLGASQTITEFRINSFANVNSFTIGSAADATAGYTLTLTNVYRGDNNGNTQTIAANVKLAGDSLWNIINGFNGSVSVTGSIGSDSAVTLTKEGSNTLTVNGANTFTGGVRAQGGTLSLGGTNAFTGNSVASGGTLQLNFNASASSPATNIINSSSTLVLGGLRGGGTLTVNGKNQTNALNSQTFNGTTVETGGSTLNIVNGISSGRTLVNLGAITRNAGGTINFVQPTVNTTISSLNGYTTTTANDASGIIGPWATVGGTEYATNNGTNIVAYTGYTDQVGNVLSDGTTTNLRITSGTTGDISQGAGTTTVNTIRVNDAAARTITVGAGNTLRVNGVLATGTNGVTIGASGNAGSLTAGSADDTAAELVFNNTTAATVNSAIVNNGTGAVSLTKAGSGTLTLNGTNTYNGGTTVNSGTLALLAGSTDLLATSGAITVNGGTFALGTGTNQTVTGALTLAGGTISGGTLTNNGSALDARNGTISARLAGSAGINKTTAGTLTLSSSTANTFTGDTVITEGSIVGGANTTLINGNLIIGSVSGGNAASYSNSGSNTAFNASRNLTVYSNGSASMGSGAQNLSGNVTILGGTITGGQIYLNTTVNMTGGTWSATTYGTNNSFSTSASALTATVAGSLNSTSSKTFTVADGTAATDLLLTASLGNGNVTKNGAGLMSMRGSRSFTGVVTVNGGTLSVDTLANGGSNSSIGASTNAASNLVLNGSTLQYTGAATSTDRRFTVGTGGATLDASGTGAVNFTNTSALTLSGTNTARTFVLTGSNTDANTLAGVIPNNGTGATTVNKTGSGTWVLTGANTYTGPTNVSGGTLVVNGSLASSAVSVTNGGRLGGSGTIAGTLDISSGGILSPGNSPGTLNSGGETWGSGGSYLWEINALATSAIPGSEGLNPGWDFVNISGVLNITAGAGQFELTLDSLAALDSWNNLGTYQWRIATASGGVLGFSPAAFDIDTTAFADQNSITGGAFTVTNIGNDIFLNYTAIPEPSITILIGLGLVALCGKRRREVRVS